MAALATKLDEEERVGRRGYSIAPDDLVKKIALSCRKKTPEITGAKNSRNLGLARTHGVETAPPQ